MKSPKTSIQDERIPCFWICSEYVLHERTWQTLEGTADQTLSWISAY